MSTSGYVSEVAPGSLFCTTWANVVVFVLHILFDSNKHPLFVLLNLHEQCNMSAIIDNDTYAGIITGHRNIQFAIYKCANLLNILHIHQYNRLPNIGFKLTAREASDIREQARICVLGNISSIPFHSKWTISHNGWMIKWLNSSTKLYRDARMRNDGGSTNAYWLQGWKNGITKLGC